MPQANSPEDFIGSLPKKLLDQGVTGLIMGACGAGCVVAAKTYAPNLDMPT